MRKILGILAVGIAAICATGCKDASEKVGTTHTTAAELDQSPAKANLGSAPTTEPTKDDYLSTVHREQATLKNRLDDAISATNRDLGALQRSGRMNTPEATDLQARKQTLEADSTVLAHSDERGWDELKATVEHDIEEP